MVVFYETKMFSRKFLSHKSHINTYQKIFKTPIGFGPKFFSPAIATKITETKYLLFTAAWNLIPNNLVSRLIYCRTKYARFQVEDKFSPHTGRRNPWQPLIEVIRDKLTTVSMLYSTYGLQSQTAWVQTLISPHTACVAYSKLLTLFVPQFHNLKGNDNITSLIYLLWGLSKYP